jgi:hypothetical protein
LENLKAALIQKRFCFGTLYTLPVLRLTNYFFQGNFVIINNKKLTNPETFPGNINDPTGQPYQSLSNSMFFRLLMATPEETALLNTVSQRELNNLVYRNNFISFRALMNHISNRRS